MTLDCAQARSLVSDYIDGELEPETARLLERHLDGCRNCPPLYAALVGVRARLARVSREAPDRGGAMAERVRRALGH